MTYELSPKKRPATHLKFIGFVVIKKPHFYAPTESMYEVYKDGILQGTVMFEGLVKFLNRLREVHRGA